MELFLFVTSVIFMSSGLQSGCLCPESWQWQLGALALFIAWLDMILFLKKLPLTGIYVVMFVDIFWSLMRIIFLSVLFVVSFGLAFYMLFFRPVRTCVSVYLSVCLCACISVSVYVHVVHACVVCDIHNFHSIYLWSSISIHMHVKQSILVAVKKGTAKQSRINAI